MNKTLVLKLFTVALLLPFLSACQIAYLTESAYNHLKIMGGRQKIQKVLLKKDLPKDWKKKLKLTQDIRPFIEELGLNVTHNYNTFVDIKRPYVSYLLTVAPEYSLAPKVWSFPFAGRFPYKGFYKKEKAVKAAKKFQDKNFDTYIRGVSAYSTLGWFNDPILSSMLKYSEAELIETVIHESVHATVFIKNNVSFNEQLAVFVAQKGTLEYYKKTDLKAYENLMQSFKDETLFLKFINNSIDKLTEFYAKPENHDPKKKAEFFKNIKNDFDLTIKPQLKVLKFTYFNEIELNNAYFAGHKVYFDNQERFEKKYQEFNNIKDFITYLKKEKKNLIKTFTT